MEVRYLENKTRDLETGVGIHLLHPTTQLATQHTSPNALNSQIPQTRLQMLLQADVYTWHAYEKTRSVDDSPHRMNSAIWLSNREEEDQKSAYILPKQKILIS